MSADAPASVLLDSILRVTEAVSGAGDLDDVCRVALDGLELALGATRSSVLLFDEAGVMRFRAWRGLSDGYRASVDGHSPWTREDRSPEPIVVADVEADASLGQDLRAIVLGEGIRALAFVPMTFRGRLLGKFMVYFAEPRALGEVELALARVLAGQIGFAIARLSAEQEVVATRDQLSAVLQAVPDGITAQAPDGQVVLANDEAARLIGYADAAELVSRPTRTLAERFELVDEAGAPVPWKALPGRLALTGRAATGVYGWRPADGSETRWTEVTSRPVVGADGRVQLAVNVFRDVTGHRRELDNRRFLLEAGAVLASSLDVDATLARVAELAVPRLADWCVVTIVAPDGAPKPVAVAFGDPARLARARLASERWPARRDAPLGVAKVLRTGEPDVVHDISDDLLVSIARDAEHLALMRSLGLRSAMTVPMRARGVILGAISFVSAESRHRFDDEDLAVARKLADRAAVAIDNARLFAETRRAREELDVTLRSIGDAVVATDTAGRVTVMNPVAEHLTGYAAADVVGRPLADVFRIFREGTADPVESPVDKVLRTGRVVGLANHTVLEHKGGQRRAIADSAAPIRRADGEVLGVVLVFRDVTDEQRLEAELAKASKLESLGVLAGGIAHDFNNILTTVIANLSLVEHRVPADHPARARVKAANAACERAKDLTRQLLTFSRGGAPLRSPTSLEGVLRDGVAFALQGSRTRADVAIAPGLWAVDADAGQLSQVMHNLVLNADQAMPSGGVVRVAAENVVLDGTGAVPLPAGRYVRVTVADTGPGIAPEHVARIFDPFFTTKPQGSGLGLTTSYSIARRHDGHLGVESSPGGATFTLHLPAAEQDAPEASAEAAAGLAGGQGRVLVMDDDPMIRDLARECLAELGYDADFAADGAEALSRWSAATSSGQPFDVAIFDLTIPGGMGGREAMRALREIDPRARALVSSGYSNDPVMSAWAEHGFAGVIQKPWRLDDLDRTLKTVLGAS